MCGVAGKSGLGEADETRSVMPGYQSVWIHVQLTPQDVLHNPPLRKNFRILDVFFQSCLQERRLGYCSHIGAGRFWVWFPAVMCGHILLTSEWVFSFGFFLRSMNIRWTGDWCTGGLSRLLPSDHWDRLQHHLSPWSRISRITEDKWPDTFMLKVKGRFLGSWSVMEAEWCICFLSMADKIKATSLVSPSIGLFLPNKSRGKKTIHNWMYGGPIKPQRLFICASNDQLDSRSQISATGQSTWLDMLNQLGRKVTRTENTDSVKHQKDMGIPERAAMAELVSPAAPQHWSRVVNERHVSTEMMGPAQDLKRGKDLWPIGSQLKPDPLPLFL